MELAWKITSFLFFFWEGVVGKEGFMCNFYFYVPCLVWYSSILSWFFFFFIFFQNKQLPLQFFVVAGAAAAPTAAVVVFFNSLALLKKEFDAMTSTED